jgi:hypothetical protein
MEKVGDILMGNGGVVEFIRMVLEVAFPTQGCSSSKNLFPAFLLL